MKFKMQDKQNQLVERISAQHLVVGVDIAQEIHVARAVNFRGIFVGDPSLLKITKKASIDYYNWINELKNLNTLILQ